MSAIFARPSPFGANSYDNFIVIYTFFIFFFFYKRFTFILRNIHVRPLCKNKPISPALTAGHTTSIDPPP